MPEPTLSEFSMTFEQDADACADDDLGQWLTIESHDGGAGPYLVLRTERWALESPDDLQPLLAQAAALMERIPTPPDADDA